MAGILVADAPIGRMVDAGPALRPGPLSLDGRFCRVERLDRTRHGRSLWQAMKDDDRLWTYLAYGPFRDQAAFLDWIEGRARLGDPLSYAVIDKASDRATGIVTLMEIRPEMRVIEIGNIVYAPALQRTVAATEAQYLMARLVFDDLGYRRHEWKCNALNAPSRRAALRLGFTFEGIFRNHMIVKGRSRDTAWYSMTDEEWPAVRARFERWLRPENFDAAGRQKIGLSQLRQERDKVE